MLGLGHLGDDDNTRAIEQIRHVVSGTRARDCQSVIPLPILYSGTGVIVIPPAKVCPYSAVVAVCKPIL